MNPLLNVTAPLGQTERFDLWLPRAGDVPDLCRLLDSEGVRRFLGPARAEPAAQYERLTRNAGSWALYGYGTLAVRPRGEDEIIATCGVFHSWRGYAQGFDDEPEAGWIVREDWWGQGVASEAMRAILAWFDQTHGPRRIACMIEEGNAASERLAASLGFTRYGEHRLEDGDKALLGLFERVPQKVE